MIDEHLINQTNQSDTIQYPEGLKRFLEENNTRLNFYVEDSEPYKEESDKIKAKHKITEKKSGDLFGIEEFKNLVRDNRDDIIKGILKEYLEAQKNFPQLAKEFGDLIANIEESTSHLSANAGETFEATIHRSFEDVKKLSNYVNIFTIYLRRIFNIYYAEWGSIASDGAGIILHDFLKPLNYLVGYLGLADLGEEYYADVYKNPNVNIPALLDELIAEGKIINNYFQTLLDESAQVSFGFKYLKTSLRTRLEGLVDKSLDIKVNGNLLDDESDFDFKDFKIWIIIHTLVLNALQERGDSVHIEVDTTNEKFLKIKVRDDVEPRVWGTYVKSFKSNYDYGKNNPDAPWVGEKGGGDMAAYLMGQTYSRTKSPEDLVEYHNEDEGKYIELKFPK